MATGVQQESVGQELDGDGAAQSDIARRIDHAHASRSQLLEDLVMGDLRPDQLSLRVL